MRVLVLAAAALALAACATSPTKPPVAADGTARPPGTTVVPWLNRPAARAIELRTPSWRAPRVPRTAPLCANNALRPRSAIVTGAMGSENLVVRWANRGTKPCRAAGYPTIAAVVGHRLMQLRQRHVGSRFDGPPANIAPGRFVQAIFTGLLDCPPGVHRTRPTEPSRFRIALPSGATAEVHHAFATGCGVDVEALGVPSAIRPLQWRMLDATVHVPSRLHPGELRYTVTLTNPCRVPYALRPCPTYVEYLGAVGRSIEVRYHLNCSTVHTIAPHSSVTYAMRFHVPAMHAGVAKFVWHVDGRYAPAYALKVSVG